jgi:hypothetical protein
MEQKGQLYEDFERDTFGSVLSERAVCQFASWIRDPASWPMPKVG